MKCLVGADTGSGLVYAVLVAPANAADVTHARRLSKPDEFYSSYIGHAGVVKRFEVVSDERLFSGDRRVAMRPDRMRALPERDVERFKAAMRFKLEHLSSMVKGIFATSKRITVGYKVSVTPTYSSRFPT